MSTMTGLTGIALMVVFVLGMCAGAAISRDQSMPYLRRARQAEDALRQLVESPPEPVLVAGPGAPPPAVPVVCVHVSPSPSWPPPLVVDAQVVPALTTSDDHDRG